MTQKITVAILFGGKSVEHEVSLQSAKNVIAAIDRSKYNLVFIGIDKSGKWHLLENENYLLHADDPKAIALGKTKEQVIPYSSKLLGLGTSKPRYPIDIVFPVLHGSNGEDGTVQGLLKLADIPFVGADVLGSAIGMDKDVMKRLLRDAGIPVANFIAVHHHQPMPSFQEITKKLGTPIFVKPANMGSSVGISKVTTEEEFPIALEEAFRYDHKILIEEMIHGREIECSLIGNEYPLVSLPCEIIPKKGFQSYTSKYLDGTESRCILPAKLSPEELNNVQKTAVEAYKVLCCEGMGRVDLFLTSKGKVYVNEINTLPGMTDMSPYAKMWEVSGLSFSGLIDKLIQYALERFHRDKKRITHFHIEENICSQV